MQDGHVFKGLVRASVASRRRRRGAPATAAVQADYVRRGTRDSLLEQVGIPWNPK